MGAPARQLRQLLNAPGLIRLVGAHNALGAKLAERHGFEGVWSSGLEISTSHAVPDASILTMSDYLAAAQSMVDAVSVPVVADCDTGYGNSNNVIRMVRQFEAAGVAAVCIEDKLFPKVNSLTSGRQELASIAEFVGKILAAKNAQRTEEFVVIARIEALIAGWPVDEALRRADAYVRAGADAILIHDKHPGGALMRDFLKRWDASVPIVVVPTAFPDITTTELESLGIKLVVYANQGLRAAVCAMNSTFKRIAADGSTVNVEGVDRAAEHDLRLAGHAGARARRTGFLRVGAAPARAIVLSAGDHRDAASMRDVAADVPLAALDVQWQGTAPAAGRGTRARRRARHHGRHRVSARAGELCRREGRTQCRLGNHRRSGVDDAGAGRRARGRRTHPRGVRGPALRYRARPVAPQEQRRRHAGGRPEPR